MPRKKQTKAESKSLEQYTHKDKKRVNNPPVGLVSTETDVETGRKTYAYDPHLDPSLQWAGKAENTSFEVPTVSLHVHERIDPRTIIEAVCKVAPEDQPTQGSLFETTEENPPLRDALQFYKHSHNWTNRLIAGDSLLVMNSLIEKEGMVGQVQMIYIDPPYGIKYGSNFQPFVNKRDVRDGKDEDLTQEPETLKAYRDTWELGIHSYLTYIRDRLLLARDLLNESGSIFVQINDANVHHVREIMDDIFRPNNFISQIIFQTTSGFETTTIGTLGDYLLWYAKDKNQVKVRKLYEPQPVILGEGNARWVLLPDGSYRGVSSAEKRGEVTVPEGSKLYKPGDLQSQGAAKGPQPFEYEGKVYKPNPNSHWKAHYPEGMQRLAAAGRIHVAKDSIQYRRFADDFPYKERGNIWTDTLTGSFTDEKIFAVQTNVKVIERCILLSTDTGELVLDPTCGSGTTAYAAEKCGRRWITCDTSRVAVTLARQRLMTALFDYYELARPDEGVGSGFKYETVPHITLKSIANSEQPKPEALYDQPHIDYSRRRVTGPFTVEAVPALTVQSLSEIEAEGVASEPDVSLARSGETLRQSEWRDELLRTGIRGRHGERIAFSRVEPLSGTRWLHADSETMPTDGLPAKRAVVSFGPQHQPLEQRQVQFALDDMRKLQPRPSIIIFAAFQFDPEASKDIDETIWPGVTLLKAQMNADLLTDDLKKKRASNESFWLIGQPDVDVRRISPEGTGATHEVEILGFDYYNTVDGTIESGGTEKVALWMLDTDYDGRSIYPRQVFFPLAGDKEGWAKLAKNLKAEIDPELIEAYRGTKSLPFTPGSKIAVKIVDDRGIESIRVMDVE